MKKFFRNRFIKCGIFIVFLLFLQIFLIGKYYQNKYQSDSTEYGVSFSIKYAEELGLDWQDTFTALVDDLGIKKLRLMSYWDLYEPQDNQFDFNTLDWQLEQAEKHSASVSLAIGARQPRYPECHVPGWADKLSDEEFDNKLIEYVDQVAKRYGDNPVIDSFQLENEAANRVFSVCRPLYNSSRLEKEFRVASANTDKPVIINVSNQTGIPVFGPIGDRVGFSIYERANVKMLGQDIPFRYFLPSTWHSFRAGLIDIFHNKSVFAHEVQAEPWGPRSTVDLTQDEMSKTMNPEILQDIIDFTKKAGLNEIYLWGGEWWYWQKEVNNNPDMWNFVSEQIKL